MTGWPRDQKHSFWKVGTVPPSRRVVIAHFPQKLTPSASVRQEQPAAHDPGEQGAAQVRTHSCRHAPSRSEAHTSPGAQPNESSEPQFAPPHPQPLRVATTRPTTNQRTPRP